MNENGLEMAKIAYKITDEMSRGSEISAKHKISPEQIDCIVKALGVTITSTGEDPITLQISAPKKRSENDVNMLIAAAAISHVLENNPNKLSQNDIKKAIKNLRLTLMTQKAANKKEIQIAFGEHAASGVSASKTKPSTSRPLDNFKPATPGQQVAWDVLEQRNKLNAFVGAPGSGKSYMLVAFALKLLELPLEEGGVEKVFLSRPPLESGHKLGYLPGGMEDKMQPYLQPLHDIIEELVGEKQKTEWEKKGKLVVAPIGFMRGLTFKNTAIILDEAQNIPATITVNSVSGEVEVRDNIKLISTRIGEGAWVGIAGDPDQTDLEPGEISALPTFLEIMSGKPEGFGLAYLSPLDNQRDPVVRLIAERYKQYGQTLKIRNDQERLRIAEESASLLKLRSKLFDAYATAVKGKKPVDPIAEMAIESEIASMSPDQRVALAAKRLGVELETTPNLPSFITDIPNSIKDGPK